MNKEAMFREKQNGKRVYCYLCAHGFHISAFGVGIWFEVTTLIVPGENDSDEELGQIADFLVQTNKNIPRHVSRYKFADHPVTSLESHQRAREIGRNAGLCYIYLGNVAEGANTNCYRCCELILKRRYMGANLFIARDRSIKGTTDYPPGAI